VVGTPLPYLPQRPLFNYSIQPGGNRPLVYTLSVKGSHRWCSKKFGKEAKLGLAQFIVSKLD